MTPHPVLREHYQSASEKQKFLRRVFDASAPYYESIVRWGSFGSGSWYRRTALIRAGLKPGMRVVDIATGTGTTAQEIIRIIGGTLGLLCVDPSEGMLRIARDRLGATCCRGEADHLPLCNDLFDFLTMGFALRHVETLEQAFGEYHRVLKPGGKALILEVTKPKGRFSGGFARWYFGRAMPWLTRRLTGNRDAVDLVKYYWDTIDQMVPPENVVAAMRAVGFQNVTHRVILGCFSEYEGTKQPCPPASS
jgi:demethylmenaquinone methyltransferase/2-methoxy-6-polyprenyl-1,4-benzoquinol methylase